MPIFSSDMADIEATTKMLACRTEDLRGSMKELRDEFRQTLQSVQDHSDQWNMGADGEHCDGQEGAGNM